MTEIQSQALAKLELESKSSKNNGAPSIPIYMHLRTKCVNDEAFASLVAVEANALEKCLDYLMEQMKAKATSKTGVQCVGVDAAEVFRVAEDYYRIGEAEFERRRAKKKAEDEARRKANVEKAKAEAAEAKKKKADTKKKGEKPAEAKEAPAVKLPKSNPAPAVNQPEQLFLGEAFS